MGQIQMGYKLNLKSNKFHIDSQHKLDNRMTKAIERFLFVKPDLCI